MKARGAVSDIALITEGAYPYVHGGVTTWCDQLVRGLPDLEFSVAAIAGSGRERAVIDLPGNVAEVRQVAIWAPADGLKRRARGSDARKIARAHQGLLDAMFAASTADALDGFIAALGALHALSRRVDVARALQGEDAVQRVHAMLSARRAESRPVKAAREHPVADALLANDLLEHFLRALWADPVRADLTHCVCDGIPVLQGLAAKWRYGTPMLLTEHGIYLRERYLAPDTGAYSFGVRDFVLRFMRLLVLVGYVEAELITPVCEFNQRWQIRLGADPSSIQPVYNGIDPGRFPVAEDEPDVPTLSWVGRIDPLKDVETLIRAFARIRAEVPDVRLRMFGPVPPGNEKYAARCAALVQSLGLSSSAVFEGREANVSRAYRAGHVVVLSSLSEAFPYTVIEGMASGRATVATDVGGVREAVGDAGLVVPPRDPSAMADACVKLLNDTELRHDLAAKARIRAMDQFTLDGFLEIYREIYGRFIDVPSVALDIVVPDVPSIPTPVGAEAVA